MNIAFDLDGTLSKNHIAYNIMAFVYKINISNLEGFK